MADTPMTPEEERVARAWIDAAAREVDFVRGGIFDIAARAFATLDAERARQHAPSEGPRTGWHRGDCPDTWGYGCNCGSNQPRQPAPSEGPDCIGCNLERWRTHHSTCPLARQADPR